MAGLVRCGCSNPECDLMVCSVCGVHDCKWPGDCKGKCAECGKYNANAFRSDSEGPPSMTCSTECTDLLWARYEADGSAVLLGDLTLEQQNEMFKSIGLELIGVGERKPS